MKTIFSSTYMSFMTLLDSLIFVLPHSVYCLFHSSILGNVHILARSARDRGSGKMLCIAICHVRGPSNMADWGMRGGGGVLGLYNVLQNHIRVGRLNDSGNTCERGKGMGGLRDLTKSHVTRIYTFHHFRLGFTETII